MKKLDSFAHKQFKLLAKHLEEYQTSQEVEALHGVRVEIKKVKPLLGLIKKYEKGFKPHKHFLPLRNIFRSAGEIREPGVILQMLMHHQITGVKDDLIPPVSTDQITRFVNETPAFIRIAKQSFRKLYPHLKGIDRKALDRFIKAKIKEVRSSVNSKLLFQTIHKVRKTVKEVIYLSEIRRSLKKKELAFYDMLQDSIGKLHDKQVVLELINKSKRQSLNAQYEVLKKEILADKKCISKIASEFYH